MDSKKQLTINLWIAQLLFNFYIQTKGPIKSDPLSVTFPRTKLYFTYSKGGVGEGRTSELCCQ